jgi:hypothetical protein
MKHLITHYGDNNGRLAKIYLMDEQTYVVYCHRDMKEVNHVYVDTAQQAESIAEDFVLEA